MDEVRAALLRLGGVAQRAEIEKALGRPALERAVAEGVVVRVARGRYAIPVANEARRAALRLTGTAILLSAAAHWGWPTKWPADRPQIAVPPGRKVAADVQEQYDVRWRTVAGTDRLDGWVTHRVRTLHDCCAMLPFDEALAVVDGALAEGRVSTTALRDLAGVPPRLHPKVRRVLDAGIHLAHNPFESVVRAVALRVPGLHVVPQVPIDDDEGRVGRVDLADVALRIVIECDSSEFHSGPADFAADCERYSRLTVDDWIVVRVPWRMAMRDPERLHRLLLRAVALRARQGLRPYD